MQKLCQKSSQFHMKDLYCNADIKNDVKEDVLTLFLSFTLHVYNS